MQESPPAYHTFFPFLQQSVRRQMHINIYRFVLLLVAAVTESSAFVLRFTRALAGMCACYIVLLVLDWVVKHEFLVHIGG